MSSGEGSQLAGLLRAIAFKLRRGERLSAEDILLLDGAAALIDALEIAVGEMVKYLNKETTDV